MGMAHRGRLNTLINIFEKRPKDIFSEFEGKELEIDHAFDGDVKYHQGYTSVVDLKNGKTVGLTLSPNPSHLEAVDPVVQGIARAKIDHILKDETKICPVMIHGDAAVAGQGIVYEVLQMAQLDAYRSGGTIHIVVNNQVGFTTNFTDGRSSTYCTDVAKTTLCPVFHVNGDDVEAVVQTMEIAMEYRQKFSRDVFIDLLCYRKYGHNEGDEPKFTQPKLYDLIAKHPNPKDIYFDHILYQSIDLKTSDPYNRCRETIRGTKGVKTEFDKTQLSKIFTDINKVENGRQNILLCFRTEAFNVISNIVGSYSDEHFNKDYNRIFHFHFSDNNYIFDRKINLDDK